jgi:phosphatidylinositol alpha 1,6-mannosyltransferase
MGTCCWSSHFSAGTADTSTTQRDRSIDILTVQFFCGSFHLCLSLYQRFGDAPNDSSWLYLFLCESNVFVDCNDNVGACSVTLTIRKIEQEILAQGYHVCILTTKSGNMKHTHMEGEHPNRKVIFLDNSIPIPFLHDPHHPEDSYHLGFSLSRKTRDLIEAFEPSLIHITVPDDTCSHLIEYARQKELPLMGTYHSNIPDYMTHYPRIGWLKHVLRAYFRHQYNFLQALYVPTPFIHKHLTDTSKLDKVTNLGVWGRGIDLERFSPRHRSSKFRAQFGFDDNDVVLVWVGRLVPEKRPDIFIDVVRRLTAEGVPFKALVVGAGPCEEEVKALPNTVFAGWMSGDQLATAYASSDVFLFPSAVETFGNVTLEAAASGLPLVVEAGCSGHLVNHGVNGFACQDGDLEGFYNGTLCLVLDHMRRKSMSEEGRQLSMQFEKRVVCRKMIENYGKVTNEFYSVYGGRHSNRDQVYTRDHSFHGGCNPRPFTMCVAEYIFIQLFRVMYQMFALFLFVQAQMLRGVVGNTNNVHHAIHHTASSSPTRKVTANIGLSSGNNNRNDNSEVVPGIRRSSVGISLDRIVELDEGHDSDGDSSSQQSSGSPKAAATSSLMVPAGNALMSATDDETDSTACESCDSSTDNSSSRRCFQSSSDLPLSHKIAIVAVELFMLQFRMECQLRRSLGYVVSPSKWNLKRKRKNSAELSNDVVCDMMDLDRPYIIERDTSDSTDVSTDEMDLMMSNSREERLNMRRATSQFIMLEVGSP